MVKLFRRKDKITNSSVSVRECLSVFCLEYPWGWDSEVVIATGYGLNDRGDGVRVQTGSRVLPASFTIGNGDSFPDGKTAGD